MMSEDQTRISLSTWLVISLVAILPMSVATGFSNFERARQVVLVIGAGLALVSWGLGLWRRRGVQRGDFGVFILGGAWLALVIASVSWSALSALGILSAVTWASLGVVFLVLVAPVGRRPDFSIWATTVAIGMLGAGLMGLYDAVGGQALQPVWNPSGVTGGFDSLYFATGYYVLAIPVVSAGAALIQDWRRWMAIAALLVGSIHLAFVVDAVSLVILVLAALVMAGVVGVFRRRETGMSPNRGLVFFGVSLLIAVVGSGLVERPDRESDAVDLPRVSPTEGFERELATDEQVRWPYFASDRITSPVDLRFRPYINSVTRGMWQQKPVAGHGAGGWWAGQTDIIHDGDEEVRGLFERYPAFVSPHGDWNRIIVEQGGLGLLLFLLWLVGVAAVIAGGLRRGEWSGERRLSIWALMTSFSVGAAAMYYIPILELGSAAVVWVGSAAMAVQLVREGAGEESEEGEGGWLMGKQAGRRLAVAWAAVFVGTIMIVPAALNGRASLERGHADHLMLRSHFEDAADHFVAAHRLYPAYPEALYNAALALIYTGAPDQGQPWIDEALRLRPFDSRFLAHSGYLALRVDRIDTALEMGREAVRTGPNYIRGYEVYTAALERRARYKDSADVYEKLIEREPPARDRARALRRVGRLYENQLNEPERALQAYERALELMDAGLDREILTERAHELDKLLQRNVLEKEGLPIPQHLQPAPREHDHAH